jgi:hypothetical protein
VAQQRVVCQLTCWLLGIVVASSQVQAQQPATAPSVPQVAPPQPAGNDSERAVQPRGLDARTADEFDALPLPDILQDDRGQGDVGSPDFGDSSQIPALQALDQSSGQQFQGTATSQLAATPKMLGDFFGNTQTNVTVGEFFGEAVHQTIASGSAFANNNLSLITVDNGTSKVVFVGGPGGLATASFFLPSIAPPLDDVVTGLTANGTDGSQQYTAVITPDTVDVFDNPADGTPSIPEAPVYNMFAITNLVLPAANPGDIVGRVRMQDNNSAMPQDRFYFDYNYFHNVRFTGNGFGVNRFVPGVEKTFWDGMGSVEVRMPMAVTLNSDAQLGQAFDTSSYQFGNLTVAPKLLLWASEEEAFAAGLGISLPTADDIQVFGATEQVLRVNNQSVHLIPYLAYLYAPRRTDYFVHAFLTLDVDTAGNDVDANLNNGGLEHVGVINDQNLLSASAALGKYVYRNECRGSRLKSAAWSTELHYTTTVNNADVIEAAPFDIGSPGADLSLLNGTIGGHLQLQKSIVTVGYTVPLTSNDRVFDGEFRVFINRPF